MPRIELDIRRWLGDGKTFVGMGEAGIVRSIVNSYQSVRAEEIEQLETLETLARITGFDGVLRMLGSAICESDGSRTLKLEPKQ